MAQDGTPSVVVDSGSLTLHLMLHAIGEERYEVTRNGDDALVMNVSFETSDRGNKTSLTARLIMKRDFTPQSFEINGSAQGSVVIRASTAAVREINDQREMPVPQRFFVGFGGNPFSVQGMMLRYWTVHGRPGRLPILRAYPGVEDVEVSPNS